MPRETWTDRDGRGYVPWTLAEIESSAHDADASPARGLLLFHFKTPKRLRDEGRVLKAGDAVSLRCVGAERYSAKYLRMLEDARRYARERTAMLVQAGPLQDGTTPAIIYARVFAQIIDMTIPRTEIVELEWVVENVYYVRSRAEEREIFGADGPQFGGGSTRPQSAGFSSVCVGIASLRLVDPNWADVSFVLGFSDAVKLPHVRQWLREGGETAGERERRDAIERAEMERLRQAMGEARGGKGGNAKRGNAGGGGGDRKAERVHDDDGEYDV
jgi:hypothetical protein